MRFDSPQTGFLNTPYDRVVQTWIVVSRILAVTAASVLAAYLLTRPFWMSGQHQSSVTLFGELSTWPTLMWNTLIVASTASLVSLIVALPLATILFRTDLPGRWHLTTLVLMLACVPTYATAAAVMSVVGVRTWEGSAVIVGVIHGWLGVPLATLQLGLGYRAVNRTLDESAAIETSPLRAWWHIHVPLIRWSILSVVLLQTWLSGTDIVVSDLLSVRTFAEEVYVAFQLSRSTLAPTLVIAPYVICFGTMIYVLARSARSARVHLGGGNTSQLQPIELPSHRRLLWSLTAGVIAATSVFPLLVLARQVGSFSEFRYWVAGLRTELCDSVLLAVASASFVTWIAMGVAPSIISHGRKRVGLTLALVFLFALPSPCLALALIELLNRDGPLGAFYDSFAAPILGQTLRWLPLAVLICLPGFANVSRHLHNCAQLDGCSQAQLHRHLYWPICLRYIGVAWLAIVILVLGELTISIMMSPPGVLPLSVRFFTLAHYGLKGQAATICLVAVLVTVIPWSLMIWLLFRRDASSGLLPSARA